MVLAPGATVAAHTRAEDELLYIEQGALTVVTLAPPGTTVPDTGDGPGVIHREMYGEGRSVVAGPSDIQTWENQTTAPTVVLSSVLLRGEEDAVTPMLRAQSPTPRARVAKRVVLTGGGVGGRYRITVRDRSGHLTGARLPRNAELRFASGGPSLTLDYGSDPRAMSLLGAGSGPAAARSSTWISRATSPSASSATGHLAVMPRPWATGWCWSSTAARDSMRPAWSWTRLGESEPPRRGPFGAHPGRSSGRRAPECTPGQPSLPSSGETPDLH